jgi:hypothetical protein
MTPIPLEEPTKKDLAEEYRNMNKKELIDKIDDLELQLEDELIHKRMNDINTFQAHENEVYLRGTDEYGKDFQICFDSYNFLDWIDTEHLEYIKEQLIKYIKTK